jgi:hypothetical protein
MPFSLMGSCVYLTALYSVPRFTRNDIEMRVGRKEREVGRLKDKMFIRATWRNVKTSQNTRTRPGYEWGSPKYEAWMEPQRLIPLKHRGTSKPAMSVSDPCSVLTACSTGFQAYQDSSSYSVKLSFHFLKDTNQVKLKKNVVFWGVAPWKPQILQVKLV